MDEGKQLQPARAMPEDDDQDRIAAILKGAPTAKYNSIRTTTKFKSDGSDEVYVIATTSNLVDKYLLIGTFWPETSSPAGWVRTYGRDWHMRAIQVKADGLLDQTIGVVNVVLHCYNQPPGHRQVAFELFYGDLPFIFDPMAGLPEGVTKLGVGYPIHVGINTSWTG